MGHLMRPIETCFATFLATLWTVRSFPIGGGIGRRRSSSTSFITNANNDCSSTTVVYSTVRSTDETKTTRTVADTHELSIRVPPSPSSSPCRLLSLTLDELGDRLDGKGRARSAWDCYRVGAEPLWFHNDSIENENEDDRDSIRNLLPPRRRKQRLGRDALRELAGIAPGGIEGDIATISDVSVSGDGTTKLLVRLSRDGAEVETVIIPFYDRGSSTLCVSSQVGCKQGCTF